MRQGPRELGSYLFRMKCGRPEQVSLDAGRSTEGTVFRVLLNDEGLIDEIPPWYTPDKPKSVFRSENVKVY